MNTNLPMRGQMAVPCATIIGAVSYAKAIGCLVGSAQVDGTSCVLDVIAPERTFVHLAQAQAAGRLSFVPTALQEALLAVDVAARSLAGNVHGPLAKRRAGRAFAQGVGIPVLAVRRSRTLDLDVIVPGELLAAFARLEAAGELTFTPHRADDVAVRMSGDCVQALAWSARAVALTAGAEPRLAASGYGLLVAAAVVRMNSGARPMREQSSYAA